MFYVEHICFISKKTNIILLFVPRGTILDNFRLKKQKYRKKYFLLFHVEQQTKFIL